MEPGQRHRLDLLKRRNLGRNLLPDALQSLASALQCDVDRLQVVETAEADVLISRAREEVGCRLENRVAGTTVDVDTGDIGIVDRVMQRILDLRPVDCDHAFLVGSPSEWIGVVKVEIETVLRNAASVMTLDQDDLLITSPDGRMGVFGSYSTDGYAGGEVEKRYRIIAWGW